ncbi:MAG: malectin domain-containing carbohydrate-binding protein [Flavobacteriaceae bacterium]
MTVTEAAGACSPVSTLDCEDVEVALPVLLDFSGSVANTILESGGLGTGFTAVMEHSEARRAGDLPISDPNVNGYEPSLLTLSGGNLQILSQAGIAFRKPGGSTNNNNQVNTLGVGLGNLSQSIIIKTTLLNIVTGGSAAQAGLWFGFDEDNFVKLDINNNNAELRVESDGLSGNGSTGTDQVQTNVGASGNDVILELIIDPTALTAEAYYTVGAGSRTQLGSLPIPANYFTGRDINAGGAQDNMSFAGIYATHRNGTQFTASFDDFSVEEIAPSTETDILSFTLPEQTGAASIDAVSHTVDIEVANGTGLGALTPTIGVSAGATINPLSDTQQDFSVPFDYTVTAEDATTTQVWTVTVTEATGATPYAANINFQDNPSSTTPPTGYQADYGKEFGNASVTIDATPYQYGWKLLADGTPIDVSDEATNNSTGVGRNRIAATYNAAPLQDQLEGTLVHYQGDDISGWADGQPRKNELFWEIEIPNGIYEVTIGLGDKSTSIDSRHSATIEGYTIIPAFVPTPTETRVATMIVEVTDGLLTMNGLGGFNSKITHIDIVESTGTPVSGVLAFTPNTTSESLAAGSTGSFSADLTGAGATTIGMIIDGNETESNDWLTLPATYALGQNDFGMNATALVENDTRVSKIIATAEGFTPAILDADLTVTAIQAAFLAQINFQDNAVTPPSGYAKDYGKEFGNAFITVDATNYQYGWRLLADGTPFDASDDVAGNSNGVGRNRLGAAYATATPQEQLEGSLVHFQGDNIVGWAAQPRGNELFWEMEIPNGIYDVTLGLGDTSTSVDSRHSATVEGITILPATAAVSGEVRVTSMTIEVTDGLLTINGLGGFNTKITHLIVASSTGTPVNGALTFTPNIFSESLGTGATGSFASDLAGAGATGIEMIIDDVIDPFNDWLTLPGTIALGTLNFATDATTLLENDTRSDKIIATAAGFAPAVLDADLTVTAPVPTLSFDVSALSFTGGEGETIAPQTVNLSASSGTPTIVLADDPDASGWLIIPTTQQLGALEFGIQPNLPVGTYTTNIMAIDQPDQGYVNAEMTVTLEITEVFDLNVNFSDAATAPPSGYEQDSGLPYGLRANGFTYGWLETDGTTPVDLSANARNRGNGSVTLLQNTLIHMQYGDTGGTNGNSTEGIWEVEVPNGIYDVSVSVGDPAVDGAGTEPLHTINVEGTQIIDQFSPTGAAGDPGRFTSASTTVSVSDGRLTIDASGGFNTKITNIEIIEAVGVQAPQVVGVIPADGSANISVNASISANNLFLPNFDTNGVAGVNNSTITNSTVKLFKQGTTVQVGATVNGTGGGDAINLQPNLPLEANTTYIFEIDGVEDTTGIPFEFFTSTFTTGNGNTGGNTDLDNVSFTNAGTVDTGVKYSTLTIGPDDKLYGLSINGDIHRWDINADGTLANEETLTAWKAAYGSRTSVGLVFDPDATAGNLIAYITHNSGGLSNAPAWDGKISRLTGANLQIEDLVVTNLPRSKRDHLTNSMAFKPGEPNVIYFNQGSNSAAGAPDNAWGNRKERLLSAAALRLDLDLLPEGQWPLNAKTTMDLAAINAVDVNSPTLVSTVGTFTEDGQSFPDDGTYNPFYVNAPLTLFADGVRNAYDLLWHTNGQLYIPTNGTAGGSNAPASIDGTRRPDGTFYNHADPNYPPISASNNNNVQRDWLFRINPASGIGYYGHPNPLRGEFVLNRGDADVNNAVYNGVVADINYRGAAFDFEFNKSPNGVIEYRSNAENGNLQGAILVVRYSGGSDIIAMVPDGPNGDVATSKIGIPGFTGFQDPLDLVEDVSTGNIYVSDYGRSEIVLLKPSNQASPQPVIALGTDQVTGDAVTAGTNTYTEQVVISNLGNAVLNNISFQITGADAAQFSVTGLPSSLNSQNSDSFDVVFDPTSNGPKFALLTISGTDADDKVIALHGLGKAGTGGGNEPSLQWILDTHLGTGVVSTGDTNAATNVIDLPGGTSYNDLLGDEVAEDSFERAVDAPVTIEVLSVYGPEANNPIVGFGWYPTGDASTTTELFTIENTTPGNGQTLNPIVNGLLEFDPGVQSFGFYNRWPFFGDRHLYSEDALNTFSGAIPHHIRVYEVPGEQDAYIIATEEHIAGFDYQDIVVLVRNIRPANDTPTIDLVKINFSRAVDAPPAGYLRDSGEGFADRGNGFSYGWLTTDGQTPLDLTSNTRNREVPGVDILQNTLNHMQYGDTGGSNSNTTEGIWEIAVPNGVYDVSVGVGDPDVDGTNTMYTINVEGTNIINNFQPTGAAGAATRFTSGSTTVSVLDGRLTIDAFGGFNTKINSLEIVQVGSSTDPIITATFDGIENAPGIFRGPVQVTLEALDQSGSGITLFEYQLDSDPLVPYTNSFTVSGLGAHVLVVNAEDADGNSTQEIYNFTIEAPTGAIVSIENMTKIPGTNRGFPAEDYFTFYRHRNPGVAEVHDSNVLRINNTGTGDLTVTDVIISDTGAYSYVILPSGAEPVTLPITIASGASRDLDVTFIADPGGGNNALFKETLQIVSNADNGLEGNATLHGGFTPQPEGGDEINAQEVFDVFGFQTSMLSIVNDSGTITPPNANPVNPSSNYPDPANIDAGYEGDLILADAFVQADPSQPVRGLQLSALHGGPSTANARFVRIGENVTVGGMSFTHNDLHYQTLLPQNNGGDINNDATATVSEPFRIAVAGYPTDGGNNVNNNLPNLLGARVYKAIDQDGNVIPNEYIVLQDYIGTGCGAGSANCDWNDNTFYFINIRPQAVPTAQPLADFPAEIDVPFSIDFLTAFDKGYAGNVLTYEATYQGGALPAWITFDPEAGTIEGTPPIGTDGTFDILINATDLNGLTASTTQNIIVGDNEAPVAVATATPESGQAALVVQFTGSNSTDDNNDIVSYLWDFGDTNTSTEEDPEHTFTSAGIYNVSLTVTDGGSLTDVANVTITVSSPPTAPIAVASADVSTGDAPLTVNFTGSNSTDATSYSWDFDDGGATSTSADAQHTFNNPGIYNVVLTATGPGGFDTASVQITVSDPNANFALRINAGGPQVTFNSEVFEADQNFVGGKVYANTSAEVPELYQTERSANPPATFDYAIPLEDGQYNVTLHFAEIYWGATGGGPLTSDQRIFDVVMEGVTILDDYDINADVGPQTPVTKTFPVTMTDGTLNLTFDAIGPDGVNQPKLSAIEIVGTTTAPAPVAVAEADVEDGDAPLTVNFTGSNSTDATSYSWDFDDAGASSTEADPEHTFTDPGVYNVVLTVNGPGGTDTANIQITVNTPASGPVAVASADVTSGDAPLTVNFTGSNSTDTTGFSWDFDDAGASSNLADPQHTFNSPGIYNVVLTVTGPGGTDTANVQITVTDPANDFALRINAGGPQLIHNSEVFEADQHFDGGRAYTNASAEVADLYKTERSSNQREFDYNIPLPNGDYQVILHFAEIYWGATGGGALGTAQRVFDVTMEGNLILDDYDINAEVGPQTEVTKTFPVTMTDGTLNLNFDATGLNGVDQPKLSAIEIIGTLVSDPPVAVASADVNVGDAPLTVNFTGSSSTNTTSYSWDFDDGGASSTLADPQHTFNSPGIYNVVLTVTGPGGTDTANVQITVNDPVNDFALRINAGGPQLTHNNEVFEADQNFDGGRAYTNASAEVADLYKTERSSNQREFDYNIPLPNGDYQVILHFAEIYWGATGGGALGTAQRVFDVTMEGNLILDDYDINADFGPQTEVTKNFPVTMTDVT